LKLAYIIRIRYSLTEAWHTNQRFRGTCCTHCRPNLRLRAHCTIICRCENCGVCMFFFVFLSRSCHRGSKFSFTGYAYRSESSFGCVLAYHCVHGTAPAYLADSLRPTSEFVARRHLRSADTTTLLVPPTRRVTFGDRAFPVAAARAWNSLPAQIRAASSLLSFRLQTKAHLSQLWFFYNLYVKCPCNFSEASL